ncbi:hypothetical protein V865_005729 [Kwoniella europaea PYCC6329]|uniref:Uncharacterized protein n=1 Tax=Kwoniella europaea PYCC6329 TaxID=1423913 RepID=A0AAX4KQK1_9TREE
MSVYVPPPQMSSHNPTPVTQQGYQHAQPQQPHGQHGQSTFPQHQQHQATNGGYQSSTPSNITSPTHSTITITNGTTIPVVHPSTIQTITPVLHGKPVTSSASANGIIGVGDTPAATQSGSILVLNPVNPVPGSNSVLEHSSGAPSILLEPKSNQGQSESSGGVIVFNPSHSTGIKAEGGPVVLAPPGGGPIVVVDTKPNTDTHTDTSIAQPNGATVVFNPSATVPSNSDVARSGSNTVFSSSDSTIARSGVLPIPKEIIDKVKWETEACFYVPIAAKELAEKGVIHLPLNEVEKTKAHQLLDYCLFGEGANLYRNVLAKGDALRFREKLDSFEKKVEHQHTDINIGSIKDQLKFELLAQLKAELKDELRSQLKAEIMDEVHTEISKINGRIDKLHNYVVELHSKQNDELSARIVAVANRVDGLKREFSIFVDQIHIKEINRVLLAAGRWAHPVPTLKGNYGPDNLEIWNDGRWTLYVPDVIKNLPEDQLDQWLESYWIGEHSRNFTFLKDVPVHVKRAILFYFIGGKCDPNFFPNEQKAIHF